MTTSTLYLHVRKKYFDQILAGTKTEEYRKYTDYWIARISRHKSLFRICIIHGYPKNSEIHGKYLEFPYRGYEIKTITHEIFGNTPTKVFAIKLEK